MQVYLLNDKKMKDDEDLEIKEKKKNILYVDTDNLKKIDNDLKVIDTKNLTRSKLSCQRLAKCNSKYWETFITLTFAENIVDICYANKQFNKFISKVRRVYNNFKYLCVPEFQKRGAVHYHLLTNISVDNSNLIFKQKDNKKFLHIKYWNCGFNSVEIVKGDIKKIVGYISKYMTKDIDNRLFSKRRYFYSYNLLKPVVSYLDLDNKKHLEIYKKILSDKKLIYQNEYLNIYNNDLITFKEYINDK